MSGHSKWATIKRQKGANDQKRGQLFTKLSKAITVAIQQGGNIADPDSNFKLRLAVEAARSVNMPKENIERAIKRAAGRQDENLEEIVYEGFGPGGISVVVEAFTDNKQRTVSEVKNVFDKNGGSMGSQGSVMYQFEKKGLVVVVKGSGSIDDIFTVAVDAGADDVEESGEEVFVYCKPEDFARVRSYLIEKGIDISSGELVYKPLALISLTGKEAGDRVISFLEKMEDLNDVQKVYTNADLPDELLR